MNLKTAMARVKSCGVSGRVKFFWRKGRLNDRWSLTAMIRPASCCLQRPRHSRRDQFDLAEDPLDPLGDFSNEHGIAQRGNPIRVLFVEGPNDSAAVAPVPIAITICL